MESACQRAACFHRPAGSLDGGQAKLAATAAAAATSTATILIDGARFYTGRPRGAGLSRAERLGRPQPQHQTLSAVASLCFIIHIVVGADLNCTVGRPATVRPLHFGRRPSDLGRFQVATGKRTPAGLKGDCVVRPSRFTWRRWDWPAGWLALQSARAPSCASNLKSALPQTTAAAFGALTSGQVG